MISNEKFDPDQRESHLNDQLAAFQAIRYIFQNILRI